LERYQPSDQMMELSIEIKAQVEWAQSEGQMPFVFKPYKAFEAALLPTRLVTLRTSG
jgi:hypothetical protein